MSEEHRDEVMGLDTLQLIELARDKDDDATNELIVRNLQEVRQYVRRKLGPRLRAKLETTDIVHSAVREALPRIGAFDPEDRESFRKWLIKIAHTKIVEKARYYDAVKRNPDLEVSPDQDERETTHGIQLECSHPRPEELISRGELRAEVESAAQELSQKDRMLIEIRLFEGIEWPQIAQLLGPDATPRTLKNVQMAYSRACARLAGVLERRGVVPPE